MWLGSPPRKPPAAIWPAAAIAALSPAIELADFDVPPATPEDVEAVLKGNIFQRHVLVGPRDETRSGGRTSGLVGRVIRRGAEIARTGDPEENTGALVDTVRHVADLLAAFGERLRAGDIIIGGSVVAPLFIAPDENSMIFALDPIGSVSVRFAQWARVRQDSGMSLESANKKPRSGCPGFSYWMYRARSVFCGDGSSPVESIVHTDFDCMDMLREVADGAWSAQSDGLRAKIHVIVFDLARPVAVEGVFEPTANNPAGHGMAA